MNLSKVAIVFNPKGGSASTDKVQALAGHLAHNGVAVTLLPTTPEPGSATRLARNAADGKVDLVVAFGGDGTACQVAEGLIGTGVVMAVYPGGTGNLFAKSFYENPTPERFAQMILHGQPQSVDMISANYLDEGGKQQRRLFMVGLALGVVADAISTSSPAFKRIFGRLVYVFKTALACLWPHARRFQLQAPGVNCTEEAAALFAMNVTPPVMASLSRGCNASDAMMDVVVFPATRPWHLIGIAFFLAFGAPERSRYYKRIRTNAITISCARGMRPNIDGDSAGLTQEIRLQVEPSAVRMVLS